MGHSYGDLLKLKIPAALLSTVQIWKSSVGSVNIDITTLSTHMKLLFCPICLMSNSLNTTTRCSLLHVRKNNFMSP